MVPAKVVIWGNIVWPTMQAPRAGPALAVSSSTPSTNPAIRVRPAGSSPCSKRPKQIFVRRALQVSFAQRMTPAHKTAKNAPRKPFSPDPGKLTARTARLPGVRERQSAPAARPANLASKRQTEADARTVLRGGGRTRATRLSVWNVQRGGTRAASLVAAQAAPAVLREPGATKRPLQTSLRAPAARPEPSPPS